MRKERSVLVLDHPESPWRAFLEDYFEGTRVVYLSQPDLSHAPDLVFADPALFSLSQAQKLKAFRNSSPALRIFRLGAGPREAYGLSFDAVLARPHLPDFQKTLFDHLPLPEKIRVLAVDDEPEIGALLRDYLENRARPAFQVETAANGRLGLEAVEANAPDIIILDIKMPEMDGRIFYRELHKRNIQIPVVVFFDAVSFDELEEIRKLGNPAVVDKGSRQSSMGEMAALLCKMVYFG